MISNKFWEKAALGALTLADMAILSFTYESMSKYSPCGLHFKHTSYLRQKDFIIDNLPWALKEVPARYPWLYRPTLFEEEKAKHRCFYSNQCY
jgi:hypothetical protein